MDANSHKIIGWALDSHMRADLVTGAIKSVYQTRSCKPRLIFHSDKGGQYRSHEVKNLLSKYFIQQSMTGKDHCFDNAKAESLFATIKKDMKKTINFKSISKPLHNQLIFDISDLMPLTLLTQPPNPL